MKGLVLTCLLVFATSAAQGAYISLQDLDPTNPAPLDGYIAANGTALEPSDTASLGVFLELTPADINMLGDAAIAGVWLEGVLFDDLPSFRILDLVFHGGEINGPGNPGWNSVDRTDTPPWDPPPGVPIGANGYASTYGYDPLLPDGAPFASPTVPVLIDELVITQDYLGTDWLYMENNHVFGGDAPEFPQLFSSGNQSYTYDGQADYAGSLVLRNAWRDDTVGFDYPLIIESIPEPASLVLLALGLLLVQRRP